MKPRIRRMVSFAQMNLAESVYVGQHRLHLLHERADVFLRGAPRSAILQRFYDALEPGGYFLLGHAESLANVPVKFEPIVLGDCRLYRKPADGRRRGARRARGGSL